MDFMLVCQSHNVILNEMGEVSNGKWNGFGKTTDSPPSQSKPEYLDRRNKDVTPKEYNADEGDAVL